MTKYCAEYKILDRHYAIERLENIPLYHSPRWRCVVDGVSCAEEHKSLGGAERHILKMTQEYLNEDWHLFDKARELCSQTSAELEKGRGKPGPRVNSLIPFMIAHPQKEEPDIKIRPKIDIRIFPHHDSPHIKMIEVMEGPDDHYIGQDYIGIPIEAFHVPLEEGREYRLIIEELPTSKPESKPLKGE